MSAVPRRRFKRVCHCKMFDTKNTLLVQINKLFSLTLIRYDKHISLCALLLCLLWQLEKKETTRKEKTLKIQFSETNGIIHCWIEKMTRVLKTFSFIWKEELIIDVYEIKCNRINFTSISLMRAVAVVLDWR